MRCKRRRQARRPAGWRDLLRIRLERRIGSERRFAWRAPRPPLLLLHFALHATL